MGFKGGVIGDCEESEEHEPSLSLHEDISLSSESRERLQSGDVVVTRGDSEAALSSGLVYSEWKEW